MPQAGTLQKVTGDSLSMGLFRATRDILDMPMASFSMHGETLITTDSGYVNDI